MGVEVMVERDADPARLPGDRKDLRVIRSFHTDFRYVDGIPSGRSKQTGGLGRESLIQQNAH